MALSFPITLVSILSLVGFELFGVSVLISRLIVPLSFALAVIAVIRVPLVSF